MIVVSCDRCGKKIESYQLLATLPSSLGNLDNAQTLHYSIMKIEPSGVFSQIILCSECEQKFDAFLNDNAACLKDDNCLMSTDRR